MAASNVVAAAWAKPTRVENPRPTLNTDLPDGVVHLRKPLEPNPAPDAYAAAIAFIAAALPPAAFTRATQAARREALDASETPESRRRAQAAFSLLMGDWGFSRPD